MLTETSCFYTWAPAGHYLVLALSIVSFEPLLSSQSELNSKNDVTEAVLSFFTAWGQSYLAQLC